MHTPLDFPPRLLLVEDDRLNAATLEEGLRAHGYEVLIAHSAEEALALLEQGQVNLAVLDEKLPGMTGLDLASVLSERYALPMVFLTAFGDPERVRSAIERGALAYLVKPIDVDQLLPMLNTVLARSDELRTLRRNGQNLQRALNERREISIAVGILMERLSIERQPAFEMLRKTARSQRRRIEDVAREMMQLPLGSSPRTGAGQ